MGEEIGKSNWLQDKEKLGGLVTIEEIDELHQEAVQELIQIETYVGLDNNYLALKCLSRMHIYLWELRDAGIKSIKDSEELREKAWKYDSLNK